MHETKLSRLFDDYAAYHRHPKNKLCHYAGIPLIVFTLVGLLSRVSLFQVGGVSIDLAVPVALLALLYDLRLSLKWTVWFAIFVLLSYLVASRLPGGFLWAGFLAGWVLQLVGHYVYEKRSPAFLKNIQQLLVGPLWILQSLLEPSPSLGSPSRKLPAEE